MLSILIVAVLIIAILGLIFYVGYSDYNVVYIKSGLDGQYYKIHRAHNNKQLAADTLAYINARNMDLFRYLKNKYLVGQNEVSNIDPNFPLKQEMVRRLLFLYDPNELGENSPLNWKNETSYTINKGEEMRICLRKKLAEEDVFHKFHTIYFVVLHELAHVIAIGHGHEDEFWIKFKWLLQEAKAAGLHDPINYEDDPLTYCGLYVDYNPYYDNWLENL